MKNDEKYQRGKIYKIVDNGYNLIYYGSTINLLCQRIGTHRGNYKKYLNNKSNNVSLYNMFDEYGIENCKIELVENYPCNNKEELLKREGYYISNNECINKLIAGRTQKERYELNKEHILKKAKENYEKKKELKKEKQKQYYEKNKDTINEKQKQYYEKNKDTINGKRRKKD